VIRLVAIAACLGVLSFVAGGCAARFPSSRAATPQTALPGPIDVCLRDRALRTLVSRFRAEVTDGGSTRSTDGVLIVQQPGALRVKLFTIAGLTVYDSLLVGDAATLRGFVRLPLLGKATVVHAGPGEVVDRDAQLAYALWAIWQPRCAGPPVHDPNEPLRLSLDPAPARSATRSIVLEGDEIRSETLVASRSASGSADERTIVARYQDYDRTLAVPLPRRIELADTTNGLRVVVRVIGNDENGELDPRLFVLPEDDAPR
jgi:hypothetical protein